jgi:hypothetical protein
LNKESVSEDIFRLCMDKLKVYEMAVAKAASSKVNEAATVAKLKEDMESTECNYGALPTSAVGIEGAGRTQHSTNLVLRDSACYAYAQSKQHLVKTHHPLCHPMATKHLGALLLVKQKLWMPLLAWRE